jgi:uncharacterized protein (TIRG00374 family)
MSPRGRLRDPRLWLGLGITALALWLSFRDVSWRQLGHDVARANWWLLIGISLPAHLWALQLRAQRWCVLARGVADFGQGPSLRATAVGFMVNNLLPLRVGELVRAWWLAREIKSSGSALLGTVILERVIDAVFLLALASFVIGSEVGRGLLFLAAAAPLAATIALRRWPGAAVAGVQRVASRVLAPARAEQLAASVASVAAGVAALRGRGDLVRVALGTALLWGVAAVIPFWATLASVGIDLGGTLGELRASFITLVWVGAAVALPSAPGFFGTYHAACVVALTPLGVPREQALAVGTLAHAVFWLGSTAFGLVALRLGGRRLSDALAGAEQA